MVKLLNKDFHNMVKSLNTVASIIGDCNKIVLPNMVKLLNQDKFHNMVKLLGIVLHNMMKSLSPFASVTADYLVSSNKTI